ncbi:hypothetical protein G210_2053 [Candida maltosa Xu316]|uniref:Uncharacterized protein n=1 Tax=Candida maltosa (strain Xu316) TaxID=1245528 RepID=M3JXA2_CANMX|nr:hypothetical protein G210_2053 [Candida maltosa Xu316]
MFRNLQPIITLISILLSISSIRPTPTVTSDQESTIYSVHEDSISKKPSDATLINKSPHEEYSIENNWIMKLNQQQQQKSKLPQSTSVSTCNLNDLINQSSSDLSKSRNISIMNLNDDDVDYDKNQIKKQRWKSIHDEKIMLANINQNLLPGVLKQSNDDYNTVLFGLEEIPNVTNSINQYDYKDLNKVRKISGYNVLPGSSNLINQQVLYKEDDIDSKKSDLYPPLESPIEDIDDISDITIKRPTLSSHRSLSEPSIHNSDHAPSLYTFRKSSDTPTSAHKVTPTSTNLESPPVTPQHSVHSRDHQPSSRSSPIRKFLHDSPKKIFKSRSSNFHHKHSNSTISNNNVSLKSSFSSSRSPSPKKLKSMLKLHKYSTSVPNFSFTTANNNTNNNNFDQDRYTFHSSHPSKVEPIDLWDIQTTNFDIDNFDEIDINEDSENNNQGGQSRISSLPSQVIGEYDKEKWRTLKALENDEI